MNVVFIVPTGIGAEIGGHAGDATPAAKLVGSVCEKLFVHPNVVNASDINEMTENMLYVEGSILDKFLEGRIGLEEVYSNRILLVVNEVTPNIINAVSAARATIGADIEILKLKVPLEMSATMKDGKASGEVRYWREMVGQVDGDPIRHVGRCEFDVLVVHTRIEVDGDKAGKYLSANGGTNVWGGVEAVLSRLMSDALGKPVVHAPVEEKDGVIRDYDGIVDARKAAEMVSICYLHCCLKGAHAAPKISMEDSAYWNTDIDFLVSPINVFGRPHEACVKYNIPIIAVEENKTVLRDKMPDSVIVAKNYLEVAGIISAKKAGVSVESVRRPMSRTGILS